MTIWTTEYKRNFKFFLTMFTIEILFDIVSGLKILNENNMDNILYSFWQMFSWIAIVLYIIYNLYTFFYLGKDRLLQLLPVKKECIMRMKMVVFLSYGFTYFILQLIRYMLMLPENCTRHKVQVFFMYAGSKAVSMISFFLLIFALLAIVKHIDNQVLSGIVFGTLFIGIIILQGYFLYAIINENHNYTWIIGVVSGNQGFNHYINIVPMVFLPNTDKQVLLENNFHVISVVINAVIAVISYVIYTILMKVSRFNYIER